MEQLNSGEFTFHVVPTSLGCDLSTEERDETRTIHFFDHTVEISNVHSTGVSVYEKITEHTYQRLNDAGAPLVIVFTDTGYRLEIYQAGDAPLSSDPCAFYTFTRK